MSFTLTDWNPVQNLRRSTLSQHMPWLILGWFKRLELSTAREVIVAGNVVWFDGWNLKCKGFEPFVGIHPYWKCVAGHAVSWLWALPHSSSLLSSYNNDICYEHKKRNLKP